MQWAGRHVVLTVERLDALNADDRAHRGRAQQDAQQQ